MARSGDEEAVARFMVEVFAVAVFFAMELITILNRCHRFPGFVYQQARFSADKKMIEVTVRPRTGSGAVCSGCHQPAPGYDRLPERRFEFIPLWGFLVFFLYSMRRVNCRGCSGVHRRRSGVKDRLCLFRYVGALSESHPREML
jgi:hypothetical protein